MKNEHLRYLVCPVCKGELIIYQVKKTNRGEIEAGILQCLECRKEYEIVRYIPRFAQEGNYTNGFGFEWMKHARTQYDSYLGMNISETRFFNETKWPRRLNDQIILEIGSGSGRFTEQVASTGAFVVSMDYSCAVDANFASNGDKDNVFIAQADLYNMPFREGSFDKVFCFGVLQHTPDVESAFLTLPRYLKPGGSLVIDVYNKHITDTLLMTKYWVRPITKNVPPPMLYRCCRKYVGLMWPLAKLLNRIPYLGIRLNLRLLIPCYSGIFDLPDDRLKEWAVLDMFDMLSPAYDKPQTIETVKRWFKEANMINVEVQYGYNGIEGRGIKPNNRA